MRKINSTATDERLAAGQSNPCHASIDKGASKDTQFLKRQDLAAGQKGHLLGHAIAAAHITPVGQREADIGYPPPEPVFKSTR